MVRNKKIPRGIRNCNPLNIRIGNTWLGEKSDPDDNVFEQFVCMEYGVRAGCCILRRYIKRYKLNTIRLIVSRWAPNNENNTESYIQSVSSRTQIGPDEEIHYENREVICKIIDAMIRVECGEPIPLDKIFNGYDMA